jgi:hypothetical protein
MLGLDYDSVREEPVDHFPSATGFGPLTAGALPAMDRWRRGGLMANGRHDDDPVPVGPTVATKRALLRTASSHLFIVNAGKARRWTSRCLAE